MSLTKEVFNHEINQNQMEANNDFLPQDYEAPKTGGDYMKLQKGENKFRILSKPILGWLDWKDKKPLRFKMNEKPNAPVDPKQKVKHFWAFVVWDYSEKKICILELTQSTIQGSITSLAKDSDWGSPLGYDIKVTKSGDGMETEYTTNPAPHKAIAPEIKEALQSKPVNLEALFLNENPFEVSQKAVVDDLPF